MTVCCRSSGGRRRSGRGRRRRARQRPPLPHCRQLKAEEGEARAPLNKGAADHLLKAEAEFVLDDDLSRALARISDQV